MAHHPLPPLIFLYFVFVDNFKDKELSTFDDGRSFLESGGGVVINANHEH